MLAYLIRRSRRQLIVASFAGVVSGVCSVLLVARINAALTAGHADLEAAAAFAAVAIVAMLGHMAASVLFERLGQHAHAEVRRHLAERVSATDYRRLEALGGARVQSALSAHSARVAEVFVNAPALLINTIVVAGCLVYMAWLSLPVFGVALIAIALGSAGYHVAHLRAIHHLEAASHEQDRLFEHFRSLVDGAKELRLNRAKRTDFLQDVLGGSIDTVRRERSRGLSIFLVSMSWAHFLVYAFIGLVLFVLVGDVPDRLRIMTGFALVFLAMVTPLESLLLNLPRINMARVSAASIDEIARALPDDAPPTPGAPVPALRRLELRGVGHKYYHEVSDDMFALGPLDLAFEPGEVTFLVGGNGSGKTTFAKLLVGLYPPESGEVFLNGRPVGLHDRDAYRQLFTAIFSDFHLFDRLLDTDTLDVDRRGNALIRKLHLQHKVRVRDGAFSTRALSQGQRKRLALVVASLEDRPFLVFDEWAADQDPVFKDVFYREVLPELRAMGKAVLVISHDDRYFHLADRIVRLENGQVVSLEDHRQALAQAS